MNTILPLPPSLLVAGSDYTAVLSMPLMFTNATRELTVTVQTSTDRVVEGTETFSLSLSVDVMAGIMLLQLSLSLTEVVWPHARTHAHAHHCCNMGVSTLCSVPPAVVRFGMATYEASEGAMLRVTASVMEGTLDREVTVTVTAGMCIPCSTS